MPLQLCYDQAQVAALHLMAVPVIAVQGQALFAALTYPPAPPLDLGHCSLEAVPAAEGFARLFWMCK